MKRLILLFPFLYFSSFVPVIAQESNLSLTGKTTDVADGTYLYLRDLVNGGDLDSAVVQNDRFRFETALPEPAMFTMLYSRDRSHFTEVWLKAGTMTFDATGVDFKQAEITGSEDQVLFEEVSASRDLKEEEKKQWEQNFFRKNPKSVVSAFVLYTSLQNRKQEDIADSFQMFSEEVQNSSLGKRIRAHLDKDIPEEGDQFVDFTIPNAEGELMKLSELQGKITLLQFWSSSCPASRSMNGSLSELYQEHHPEGFEIISISKDTSKESWLKAIEEDELSWPQLSNLKGWNGEVFSAYGIHATPSNFLIDSNGNIVGRNLRDEALKTAVKELMKR